MAGSEWPEHTVTAAHISIMRSGVSVAQSTMAWRDDMRLAAVRGTPRARKHAADLGTQRAWTCLARADGREHARENRLPGSARRHSRLEA